MTKEKFFILLEKYEQGTCTHEERTLVDRFMNSTQFDIKSSDRNKIQIKEIESDILKAIQQKTKPKRTYSIYWKVAASITLIIGLYLISTNYLLNEQMKMITKSVPYGKKEAITLADGSRVILNSGSELTYPEEFYDEIREVTLKGEAFFDVVKDKSKPFIINSGSLKTTVLGTSFNINSFNEEPIASVTVITGKVNVETKEALSESFSLMPNEQAFLDKSESKLQKQSVNAEYQIDWKDNILRFENTGLIEVARRLERWYGVTMEFEEEQIECRVTIEFENPALSDVMEDLKVITGIDYELIPEIKKVIIKGIGCQN